MLNRMLVAVFLLSGMTIGVALRAAADVRPAYATQNAPHAVVLEGVDTTVRRQFAPAALPVLHSPSASAYLPAISR